MYKISSINCELITAYKIVAIIFGILHKFSRIDASTRTFHNLPQTAISAIWPAPARAP